MLIQLFLHDDYEVTSPELDCLVEEAWKINSVIGSRMVGGNFGVCTVSLIKTKQVIHLSRKLVQLTLLKSISDLSFILSQLATEPEN